MPSRPAVPPGNAWRSAGEAARERLSERPVAAVVLGSGLDAVAEGVDVEVEIPYAELPGFPSPTVPGHAGRLAFGRLRGLPLLVFRGRIHLYEGHGAAASALPSVLSWALGARAVVLTAAVGSLVPDLAPGSLAVCADHLNLLREDVLRGWTREDGSPAFVDLSDVYDPELADLAAGVRTTEPAAPAITTLRRAVYAAVPGPSFETRAEAEYLRRIGATVVGMSLVPEAVPARALDLRVLGLLSVANAVGVEVSHEAVLEATGGTVGAVVDILTEVLSRLAEAEPDRET
ncbi:MAG: purine-nucleoside phosphorylase [Actinomycetota bacterium]